MRGLKRSPRLLGLGMLLVALVAFVGHARADITSDQSGSLIIFPKVIADGSRDTVIQIANTSNSLVTAHCFYVNAAGACEVTGSFCDVDENCPLRRPPATGNEACVHVCREADFRIRLTPQQPTIWQASSGRVGDFSDGYPPGIGTVAVPPTGPNFVGELKCVQVDRSETPSTGNALKGEAMIVGGGGGMLSQYNAISVIATNAGSNTIQFGGGQFNACPAKLIVPHYADGAVDSFTGATVNSELTLVACTELLEPQTATYSNAQLIGWDEFEMRYSANLQFGCSVNRFFSNIDSPQDPSKSVFSALQGGSLKKTTIRPQAGRQCYSGDNRCHLCGVYGSTDPALAETDPQCSGLPPNTLVGGPNGIGCRCSSDNDCPNYLTIDGVALGCRQSPSLLGVVEEFHTLPGAALPGTTASAAINIYTEGSRPGDVIVLPILP
jgi:hypothetical protein